MVSMSMLEALITPLHCRWLAGCHAAATRIFLFLLFFYIFVISFFRDNLDIILRLVIAWG